MEKKKTKFKRSPFRKFLNGIIVFFAVLVFLLLVFFGFSQTQTFRDYLRDKITSEVNNSINGTLSIEKIDGSLLTSIYLRNTSLSIDTDTLLKAKLIEIKTSPLHLLLRKIYIRKFEIKDTYISLLQNKDGSWNYESLLNSDEEKNLTKKKDSSSSFPFGIQVNDLSLKNINCVKQSWNNIGSTKLYDRVNLNDFRVDNLYLNAEFKANLKKHFVSLYLQDLSGYPNFKIFRLRQLAGKVIITEKFARVTNFKLVTDSTNIVLDAQLDSLNLFGNARLKEFSSYPLQINVHAKSFYFDDLSTFINGTKILKGKASLNLSAKGKFGNFTVTKSTLDYLNTHLELSGTIKNLNTPGKLFLNINFKNSKITEQDVVKLLPTVSMPGYKGFTLKNINLLFKGEPTRFHSVLKADIEDGTLDLDTYLDLQSKEPSYDINFSTKKLNLFPVVGNNTKLTGKGSIVGQSFNPTKMDAKIKLNLNNSYFNDYFIDSLSFNTTAQAKKFNLDFAGVVNNSNTKIKGSLDLMNKKNPIYNLYGSSTNLNIASFTHDSTDNSNLNFTFSAIGKSLDIDSMNADFTVKLDSSTYSGHFIDNTDVKLQLRENKNLREINLLSDLIDFNITGKFSLSKAIDLLTYESKTISDIIKIKIQELNPVNLISDSNKVIFMKPTIPEIARSKLKFDYNFKFKDLDLLAILTDNDKLDIEGYGSGKIENDSTNFSISANLNLDYFLSKKNGTLTYLSGINSDIHFNRDNNALSFDKLFGSISIDGKRIYYNNDFKDINADIIFNQSKLFYNLSASLASRLQTELEGTVEMQADKQIINIDYLWANLDKVEWETESSASIVFTNDFIKLKNFLLKRDNASISLGGTIFNNGEQNIKFSVNHLPGKILGKYLFQVNDQKFDADFNLYTDITGTVNSPEIDIKLNVDNIGYGKTIFGSLISNLMYSNLLLNVNTSFVDSAKTFSAPLLTLTGYAPIDLGFIHVKNRFLQSEQIYINLNSKNFNLASLGNSLPYIRNLKGLFKADVKLTGTYSKPTLAGFMKIINGSFIANPSGLKYNFSSNLLYKDESVIVDNITIKNDKATPNGGQLRGKGKIDFNGFNLEKISLNVDGNIALLSEESKKVNPFFYGDLFIKSEGPIKYTYQNKRSNLTGNINIERANITYSALQNSSNSSDRKVKYNFIVDTTNIQKNELRFRSELLASMKNDNNEDLSNLNFDYDINFNIDKNAKLQFILSPVLNQKLIVETRGNLKFESNNGIARAQGKLTLLDGSKLEFFKTFDAQGSIRFENDITNPYLDVVATYIGEEYTAGKTEEVAVKLKLNSPLSKLGENLSVNKNIFSVYVGRENIQNNIPNLNYNASNAISFILLGQLTLNKDLNQTQQSKLASIGESAAYSLLGSTLTSFVHSAFGDVISNIQLKKSGEVQFSGRIQNIKYSFGGNTQYFQIGKANIKLEYLFNPNFLIRLEQKDPVVETATGEKIRELAIKYKFRF